MSMTRAEAMRVIGNLKLYHDDDNEIWEACDVAIEALKEQRPRGEWEKIEFPLFGRTYKCSRCGWQIKATNGDIDMNYHFCTECGAVMIKRGLCAKMGLIDDAADAKPDLEYPKVGEGETE